MKYQKKPVIVEATQWFKHGDHPDVGRLPGDRDGTPHEVCGLLWEEHGHLKYHGYVCPGDWVVIGERHYLAAYCPSEFKRLYEEVVE